MNRITAMGLLLGLGSALAIYLTAAPEVADPLLGDRFAQKKYLREMRTLGGQGNVVAAEFNEWLAGLWHGQALAGTVAVFTVGAVLVFRFIATHPGVPVSPPDEKTPLEG